MIAKRMFKVLVVAVTAFLILIAGCVSEKATPISNDPVSGAFVCGDVKDYGNGILFFDCSEELFATKLSNYVKTNNVSVVTISPVPNRDRYNAVKGYFVVVKG